MLLNKLLVLISTVLNGVLTLNILGIFPYQGKSHFFVFEPYLRELAKRGHNLTVISCFPQNKPLENYHDISLAGKNHDVEGEISLQRSYKSIFDIMYFIINMGTKNCETMLSDESVQQLWKTKQQFDVIIAESFNSDCGLGLAHKLGGPTIALTTHVPTPWQYAQFGIPYNPSYVPFQYLEGGTKPTLFQRVERTLFHAFFTRLYKSVSQNVDQKTLEKYVGVMPPLEEIVKETKFLLLYMNNLLSGTRIFPTNIIEVNGYHVAKPKPLPEDIKKYIDESEHGVIYVSFGSMLKANTMPLDKLEAIIAALSELPQRVIWKWEESSLPGNPKNILLSKWLPQNDIFAHPKVVAFYSHCGLLGTTEAIYHGIPMLGMPIFGDQPSNAAAIEESGLGVQIHINELTKENLLKKFRTILDPGFRHQVKELSRAWHDRPLSPMDTAIFWTEYAARTKNFTFRTAAADVPFYQYAYLDVIAVLTTIVLVILLILKTLLSLLLSKLFAKSEPTGKKKAKSS